MHAKLLHRSPRGVTLTDAGKRFYERARDVLSRLQQAVDEVDRDEESISASLRITAPMTFGTQYLGPLLFAFMQKHPGMELTLISICFPAASILACASAACMIPR